MHIDLLLTRGRIITMNASRDILSDTSIAIHKGRIVAIGPAAEIAQRYTAQKEIDCHRKLLLPGLVDGHGHGGDYIFRGVGWDARSFLGAIQDRIANYFSTDDLWYLDGLLWAIERVRNGVTCGLSVAGSEPRSDDPIFGSNQARAAAEVGVRAVVAVGPAGNPWPRPFGRWNGGQRSERLVSFDEAMAGTEAVIAAWHHGAHDLIRVFVTPFTMVPSLPTWLRTPPDRATQLTDHDRLMTRRVRELARAYKTRIHTDGFGGLIRLAHHQDENALLGADVLLQHCHGLSAEEIQILRTTGTHVGHSPEMVHRRCPFPELLAAGVNAIITTDGACTHNSFDLLQAARKCMDQEHQHFEDAHHLPAGKLLECITIDAARALGWDDEIGSLETGKRADIIIIDHRQPMFTPDIMPVQRLIREAVGRDVETVIIDGKVIMDNRKITSVDEPAILDRAHHEALRVVELAGLSHFITPTQWSRSYQEFDQPFDDSMLRRT